MREKIILIRLFFNNMQLVDVFVLMSDCLFDCLLKPLLFRLVQRLHSAVDRLIALLANLVMMIVRFVVMLTVIGIWVTCVAKVISVFSLLMIFWGSHAVRRFLCDMFYLKHS